MALRAAELRLEKQFEADREGLRAEYPQIEEAIDTLRDVLILGYDLPQIPVDTEAPNVFAIKVDYPPHGSQGLGQFIVTYHELLQQEKHAANPMTVPLRVFTLLTISEL